MLRNGCDEQKRQGTGLHHQPHHQVPHGVGERGGGLTPEELKKLIAVESALQYNRKQIEGGGLNMEITKIDTELNIFISSLKAQVNVLEAKIKQAQKSATSKKFGDFYGILSGVSETTEEEINAVEIKLKENLI